MPLRGESIGTAYVRVLADGSGLPDSVEDAFDNADAKFDDAGSRGAKRYKKAFTEEVEKFDHDAFGRRLDDAFNRALINDETAEAVFRGSAWRKLERNLIAKWGDAGRDAADQMRTDFLRSGNIQNLERDVEGIVGRINANLDRAYLNTKRTADGAVVSLRKTKTEVDKDHHVFSRLAITMDKLADGTGRAFGKGSRNDFLNFIGSFVAGSLRMLGLLPRILGNIGEFASGFGKAFKASEGWFNSLRAGFTRMSADAEGGATSLSSLISSGIIGFPLLIVAMGGFVVILSTVAALISGIVAALIAMVSTVAFAVAGTLAPLLGLIAPVAFALGGLILLISNVSNNLDHMKKIIIPVRDAWADLGDTAFDGFEQTFNLEKGIRGITDAMRHLNPLVNDLGEAFGDVATHISEGLAGPEWKRFINTMETLAPFVIRSLGDIAGNVTAGLLNIFVILDPFVRRFLRWLERITEEFQKWTGSKEGREEIKGFLDDASESAEILWDFLGKVGEVFGTLLGGGKDTGDTLFEDMTDNLDKFNQFLIDNPDALDNFFKNGKETAEQIGEIAVSIGDIFDALDSPEGRKNLHALLNVLQGISKLAGPLAFIASIDFAHPMGPFTGLIKAIGQSGPIKAGIDNVRDLGRAIDRFLGKFSLKPGFAHGLIAWIPGTLSAIGHFAVDAVRAVDRFGDGAQARIHTAMMGATNRVHTMAVNVAETIRGIPGRLGGLAQGFGVAAASWALAVLREIGRLPDEIVGFFRGLGSRIADAIGSIGLHFDFPDPPGWLEKLGAGANDLRNRVTARGGIFDNAAVRVIAEAGPEAVVPLNRDLSQVDPSVRWLSALAQGKSMAGLNAVGAGKTISNEWHITTPTEDPVAVAQELLTRMVHTAM